MYKCIYLNDIHIRHICMCHVDCCFIVNDTCYNFYVYIILQCFYRVPQYVGSGCLWLSMPWLWSIIYRYTFINRALFVIHIIYVNNVSSCPRRFQDTPKTLLQLNQYGSCLIRKHNIIVICFLDLIILSKNV